MQGADKAEAVPELTHLSTTLELLLDRRSMKEQEAQYSKDPDLKYVNESLFLVLHFQNKLS